VAEIVSEMDYLRTREQKLRDTNESTNERVKWFAFGTMGALVGLGVWQVIYLRAYFRYALSRRCAIRRKLIICAGPSILSKLFAVYARSMYYHSICFHDGQELALEKHSGLRRGVYIA
jgi:hypothetical protein